MRFITAIIISTIIFIGIQTVTPFPYGIVLGILFAGIIMWYTKNNPSTLKDSILNYRRVDPITEQEKKQNDEALRILEKNTLRKKSLKKNILKRKKNLKIQ